MKGFDEYAYIILSHNNSDQPYRVLPLANHMKYIFPGEFDAFISFAPTGSKTTDVKSRGGYLIFRTVYKYKISQEEKMNANTVNILRPGETKMSYYYGIVQKNEEQEPEKVQPETENSDKEVIVVNRTITVF